MSFLLEVDRADVHKALSGFRATVPGTENQVWIRQDLSHLTLMSQDPSGRQKLLEIGHRTHEEGAVRHDVFIEKYVYAGVSAPIRMSYLDNAKLIDVMVKRITEKHDIVLRAKADEMRELIVEHVKSQLMRQDIQVHGLEDLEFQYGMGEKEYLLFRLSGDAPYLTSKDLMLVDAAKPMSSNIVATYREVGSAEGVWGAGHKLQIPGAAGHAGYTGLMTYHDPSAKQVLDILADVIAEKGGADTWEEAVNEMHRYLETRARVEESGELFEESYPMNA